MKSSIKSLDLDLKNFKAHSEEDRFGSVMRDFADHAIEQYSILEGMHKRMEALYLDLAAYFSFEPKQYTMDECFGDIKLFKDQYIAAAAENVARREMEEKARRAKEQKEKMEKEKRERASNKIAIPTSGSDTNDQGLMEQLLNSLHSGTAFAQRKGRKGVGPPMRPVDRRQQFSRSRSRSRTSVDLAWKIAE